MSCWPTRCSSRWSGTSGARRTPITTWVFAREDGKPLRPGALSKRFRELVKEAGQRRVRLHDLRHGAASLRLAAGADIAVVSRVLGHSSVSITSDTYSHLLSGVGKAAAEAAAAGAQEPA